MKSEKQPQAAIVKVEDSPEKNLSRFQARLDELPGWHTLDSKTQTVLYDESRNIFDTTRLMQYGPFWILMSLHRIEVALEGKDVKMKDFMRQSYPNLNKSSITRKMQSYREIVSELPSGFLEEMRTAREEMLEKFTNVMKARPRDILAAARDLPALPAGQYLEALDERIAQNRSNTSRKGKDIMDKRMAQKMVANAIIHFAHGSGIRTSSQALGFIQTPVGWAMEALAVHGVIRIKRIPIPDGVIVRRGRPRMTEEEKAAAKKARENSKK